MRQGWKYLNVLAGWYRSRRDVAIYSDIFNDGWVDRHKRPTKVYKNIGFCVNA